MNAIKKALGDYTIHWGEELLWACMMAFFTGAASVFLAGQGTTDRTTWLLAVVAAGARPALAILGTRVSGAVAKLTASGAAPQPQRFILSGLGGTVHDTITGQVYAPVLGITKVSVSSGTSTTIPAAPPEPVNTIGGSA